MKTFAPAFPDLNRVSNLNVFTLVLWLGCLLVGVLGLVLPYTSPAPPKPAAPMKVEMLNVELSREPQVTPTPPKFSAAPPDALAPPNIPRPAPVAEPSPAIAFALPVAGPVRLVEVRHAAPAQTSDAKAVALPAPQTLTFGQGEGRQPAPEYPARARREGQQGNVTIRFTVGEDGRVAAAEVKSPAPWDLLNDSALRAVRERWRFSAGTVRVYDVTIRFEMRK